MSNAFYWVFEAPEEIKPGRFTVELSMDAGGERPLSIERTFLVHTP